MKQHHAVIVIIRDANPVDVKNAARHRRRIGGVGVAD